MSILNFNWFNSENIPSDYPLSPNNSEDYHIIRKYEDQINVYAFLYRFCGNTDTDWQVRLLECVNENDDENDDDSECGFITIDDIISDANKIELKTFDEYAIDLNLLKYVANILNIPKFKLTTTWLINLLNMLPTGCNFTCDEVDYLQISIEYNQCVFLSKYNGQICKKPEILNQFNWLSTINDDVIKFLSNECIIVSYDAEIGFTIIPQVSENSTIHDTENADSLNNYIITNFGISFNSFCMYFKHKTCHSLNDFSKKIKYDESLLWKLGFDTNENLEKYKIKTSTNESIVAELDHKFGKKLSFDEREAILLGNNTIYISKFNRTIYNPLNLMQHPGSYDILPSYYSQVFTKTYNKILTNAQTNFDENISDDDETYQNIDVDKLLINDDELSINNDQNVREIFLKFWTNERSETWFKTISLILQELLNMKLSNNISNNIFISIGVLGFAITFYHILK
jgi:hypothetical protein